MNQLKIKRIYQGFESEDGIRILIDALWPRGVKKKDAHIDLWLKEIAPSPPLRKWFNHDPGKWKTFCDRYHQELSMKKDFLQPIIDNLKNEKNVTLLYSSKEERFNNANALKDYLSNLHS